MGRDFIRVSFGCGHAALWNEGDMQKTRALLAGIFFLVVGIGFTLGAVKLQIGKPTEPQPGFFPFLDGIALIILTIIFLLRAWLRRGGERQAFGRLWRPGIVVLGLILYVAALGTVGYIIATIILSAIVLRVLETKSLRVLIVSSFILAIVSYLLFDRLLGVPLPGGILARLL